MVRVGVLAVALCVAGVAEAGPFTVQPDGAGTAWVLDRGTGALRACRMMTAGPKTMDVFAGGADARPGTERRARPECQFAMRGAEEPSAPARGMLGIGLSGPQVGSGAGMLGIGGWGSPWSWGGPWGWGGGNQVIIVNGDQGAQVGLY